MSRTLVVRLDNAGDVLLTGPAVRARRAPARDSVTMLCGPQRAGRRAAAARRRRGPACWRAPGSTPEPAAGRRRETSTRWSRACRRGVRPRAGVHVVPPVAAAHRPAAADGRDRRGSARSAWTTRARCSTCATASRTTSPSRSARCRSPRPAGFPLPAGDDGRARVRRPLPDAVAPPPPARATWSCTPARRCRPVRGRSSGSPSAPRLLDRPRATASSSPAPRTSGR